MVMSAEEIKKLDNYVMQIRTFSIALYGEGLPINENWAAIGKKFVDLSNEFGRFVQEESEKSFPKS